MTSVAPMSVQLARLVACVMSRGDAGELGGVSETCRICERLLGVRASVDVGSNGRVTPGRLTRLWSYIAGALLLRLGDELRKGSQGPGSRSVVDISLRNWMWCRKVAETGREAPLWLTRLWSCVAGVS